MHHRLLCCSDTHGQTPPLADESNVLAWLHAGDLYSGPQAQGLEGCPMIQRAVQWYETRTKPVYFVRGNHDVLDVYQIAKQCRDVTGSVLPLAPGLFVAGIGWHGERYFELPMEADLRPCCQSVSHMARRLISQNDRLILLTHYPPRLKDTHEVPNDVDGGGVWFDCVREIVETLNVIAVVQGHNHQWFNQIHRVAINGRSVLILNPGPKGNALEVDSELDAAQVNQL